MRRVCRAVDGKLWMKKEAVDGGAAFAFVVGSVMRASLITAGSLRGGTVGDWLQERWGDGRAVTARLRGVHHQHTPKHPSLRKIKTCTPPASPLTVAPGP